MPRVIWAGAGAVALLVALALRFFPLPAGPENSICFVRHFVGIPCPGCGLTRAFAALARGEWAQAVRLHPLAYLFAGQFLFAWLAWGDRVWRGNEWVSRRGLNLTLATDAALLLAVWIVRFSTHTLPW